MLRPAEEEWIERALCDAERARCVFRVLSIDRKDAVAKGDNYTSELSRLKLKVVLHSGEIEERAVIYKCLPSTDFRRKSIVECGLFVTEKRMYTEVLPLMERIRREHELGEPLWGQCYATNGYESLLLEDLQVHGYRMGERMKGLDYNHSVLVMRSLAKFHSLAAVLKQRGQLITTDYEKYIIEKNKTLMGAFYKQSFDNLCQQIEDNFEPEWLPYAERLRIKVKTLMEDLTAILAIDKSNFNTLNHGDCWVNNMLFKYGEDGNPVSTRLIDFQISIYNHVGFDLQYFLSTSLQIELRPRIPEFLEVYQEALSEYLTKFGYSGAIPTLDDINGYYNKAGIFGLANGVCLLPLMKMPSKEVPDLEELVKDYELNKEMKKNAFANLSEDYVSAIKCFLRELHENGLL